MTDIETKVEKSANGKRDLLRFRRRACTLWPMAQFTILSLTPVESKQVPYMAVDQRWRLYYNPDTCGKLSVDVGAAVILHEVSHLLFKHWLRGSKIFGEKPDPSTAKKWNIAADCAINDALRDEGLKLPPKVYFPETIGAPKGKTAEFYFGCVPDSLCQVPTITIVVTAGQGQGDGDGQGSNPCQDDEGLIGGGSCADGIARPWDRGVVVIVDGLPDGMDETSQEQVIKRTIEAIQNTKHQGYGRGSGFQRLADELRPKLDPRQVILRAVRRAADVAAGDGDWSYRRPARRPGHDPRIIRPSTCQPVPRIYFLIDTSGSMDSRDIGLAVGYVGSILNSFRMRDGIHVICGGTAVESCGKVFDHHRIDLRDGGGTDMGHIIKEIAGMKPQPQLIVCATDGYTGWCEGVGIPTVALVTQEGQMSSVPDWIQKYHLTDK